MEMFPLPERKVAHLSTNQWLLFGQPGVKTFGQIVIVFF
jgi:hypothetical protein